MTPPMISCGSPEWCGLDGHALAGAPPQDESGLACVLLWVVDLVGLCGKCASRFPLLLLLLHHPDPLDAIRTEESPRSVHAF